MSPALTLGHSICDAFRFVRNVHADTLAMIRAVETLLADRSWHCNETTVSNEVSSALNAEKWLINSIYRIYVRDADKTASTSLGAIQVVFSPPEGYAEPICLCLAGRFPTPVTSKNVWDRWSYPNSVKLLRGLSATDTLASTDHRLVNLVFPGSDAGSAFVLKLCDLTDEPAVQTLLVDPLLKAIEDLNRP